MLPNEALDILALPPAATAAEIKQAYRDLVKVWQPHRFTSNCRLRHKAEEKLQQLNEAYEILRTDRGARSASGTVPSSTRHRPAVVPGDRGNPKSQRTVIRPAVWLTGAVSIALAAMAFNAVHDHKSEQPLVPQPTSVQQMAASTQPEATTPALSYDDPNPSPIAHSSHTAMPAMSMPPFHVLRLSEADTAKLEAACSPQQQLGDRAAYQTCIQAQLAMLTVAATPPDLAGLRAPERESMETACSAARQLHGIPAYNRCLTIQVADLAAEPARPDLSTLDEADRVAIEKACKNAKAQGPPTYDRCQARLIKLLADSK